MSITAEQIQNLSQRINRMLPDNPHDAVTTMAISYANVAVATGCDDDSAIEAVRQALAQMRKGDWHKTH